MFYEIISFGDVIDLFVLRPDMAVFIMICSVVLIFPLIVRYISIVGEDGLFLEGEE